MTASCCRISCGRISLSVLADLERAGMPFDPAWFDGAARISFPVPRRGRAWRRAARAAPRARTLACARRGDGERRNLAPGGFLGRAHSGEGRRAQSGAPRRRLQRPPRAARLNRPLGRIRRRRALQGLDAAGFAASESAGECAAHLRHHRYLEQALARRLRLSRAQSGRRARTTAIRSTPPRRKRGGARASRISATRRARSTCRRRNARTNFRQRSICAGRRGASDAAYAIPARRISA